LTVIAFLLGASFAAHGQAGGSGSITGQVQDPTGKIIPGARVTAVNVATNAQSEAVTNEDGYYQIPQLTPGTYNLEVEVAGFKKLQRPNVAVQVSDRLTIDLPVEVGLASETVTITDEAPLLRREDAQLGEVIDQTMIQNLPQLNRDPLELLRLAGNVQGDGGRAVEGSDTRINGGRTQGVEYFSDGIAQSTGRSHGVTVTTPTSEAIQEFKVITNGISAEYGRLSGGAVEVVTRSGSNDFHGQVFEYLRHDALNANSWNQNRLGGERTPFKNHNYGFAVGGPILLPRFGEGGPAVWSGRNRSFFFFNFDGVRFNQSGVLREASVPTLEERQGDFSNTLVNGTRTQLYDPFGRTQVLPDGTIERLDLLGGNGLRVPANRISPVSAAILSFIPLPNKTPAPGNSFRNNFVGAQDFSSQSDLWALRLDHSFTDSSKIFGRYTRANNFRTETRWFSPLQNVPTNRVAGAFAANINYDWTISPTLIFTARVGGHYDPFTGGNSIAEDFNTAAIPFDADTRRILGSKGLPWVRATTFDDFIGGPNTSVTNSTTYNAGASMVKILSRHTVKFGYEHRRYYDNYLNSGGGNFVFQHNPVQRYSTDNSWNDQDAANVLGAFLLGINDKAQIVGERTRSMNVNYHGAYVQDDFKVTPNLTLNLGIRWDMETPPSERYDKLYVWDPNAPSPFTIKPGYNFAAAVAAAGLNPSQVRTPAWVANGFPTGAIRIANTPDYPSRLGTEWHPWQFAPRLGFAYSFSENTVVRGSFAKMYLSTTGDPNGYSTGGGTIALSDAADAGWHRGLSSNFSDAISTFERPFQSSDVSIYTRDNTVANRQGTGGDPAAAAFDINSRMPRE
ncbi:MAG: TonB-dependent receptor, partial [Acidobacteriota bacterium]|nr:TonB-dependent receptor [Acidobacteriota bacterium]